jgi:hypothetical protein
MLLNLILKCLRLATLFWVSDPDSPNSYLAAFKSRNSVVLCLHSCFHAHRSCSFIEPGDRLGFLFDFILKFCFGSPLQLNRSRCVI